MIIVMVEEGGQGVWWVHLSVVVAPQLTSSFPFINPS
jgi:hypothetical protein